MLLANLNCAFVVLTSNVNNLLNGTGAENDALNKPGKLVEDYGKGFMNIGRNIFVYILAIGLLITAAAFIIHGSNQSKMADAKSGLAWKIAGGILGFGVVSLVILLETIGKGIFS